MERKIAAVERAWESFTVAHQDLAVKAPADNRAEVEDVCTELDGRLEQSMDKAYDKLAELKKPDPASKGRSSPVSVRGWRTGYSR